MTTYSYTLILNDSESIALKSWLEILIKDYEEKIRSWAWAPYYAHKMSYISILEKLDNADTQLMSTNSFLN